MVVEELREWLSIHQGLWKLPFNISIRSCNSWEWETIGMVGFSMGLSALWDRKTFQMATLKTSQPGTGLLLMAPVVLEGERSWKVYSKREAGLLNQHDGTGLC